MTLFKRFFALSTALCLAAAFVTACDDSDDEEKKTSSQGSETSSTATDYTKTNKSDIISYLVQAGKLDAKYQDSSFLQDDLETQVVGAPCFCYGPRCNYAGYERPELQLDTAQTTVNGKQVNVQAAQIFGCDNVAKDSPDGLFNGATRGCFRSSDVPNIKPAIYFPYGTCALVMSKCTPGTECPPNDSACNSPEDAKALNKDTICGFAEFGEYEKNINTFIACPDNSVLLDFVMNIELSTLGRKARLDVRGCFPGCKQDSDCHGYNIQDPITKEPSQTRCVPTEANAAGETAKVCFDMRTVATENGGEGVIHLVNPGDWKVTE